MEDGEQSAKKARLHIQVKEEANGGGGAVVASECKGGHIGYFSCIAAAGEECHNCEHGGCFDVRNTAMDAVVSSARTRCHHVGCQRQIAYHELSDHRSACPHAPCICTEPGCGFAGSPPALVAHLTAQHSWPSETVQYGRANRFQVPASEPRRRLLGEAEDDPACIFVLGALGEATALSVVCIRAAAPWRPQYTCKMWATMPTPAAPDSRADIAQVEMKVESSTSPAVVAVDEASFLTVPPSILLYRSTIMWVQLNFLGA
ncbi:uncharacterized protein [Lolium perenne]|uniref:uncharacterized protein n=1 Tax=Lolium perenne TaxID=4522 RepID=UPI003A9908B5